MPGRASDESPESCSRCFSKLFLCWTVTLFRALPFPLKIAIKICEAERVKEWKTSCYCAHGVQRWHVECYKCIMLHRIGFNEYEHYGFIGEG